MDRNSVIGMLLIGLLFLVWMWVNQPSPQEIEAQRKLQDSLARIAMVEDSLARMAVEDSLETMAADRDTMAAATPDTAADQRLVQRYGIFAPSAEGEQQNYTLENELTELTFSNKGAFLNKVWLKEHHIIKLDSNHKEYEVPLLMLNDPRNRFDYLFRTVDGRLIRSGELTYEVLEGPNSLTFRAHTIGGGYFEQSYRIEPGSHTIEYSVRFHELSNFLEVEDDRVELEWVNYMNILEKDPTYERMYSSVYYKVADDDVEHCNCAKNDVNDLRNTKVDWVSHAHQFFSANLIPRNITFDGLIAETEMANEDEDLLKITKSTIYLPYDTRGNTELKMDLYVGPNDFETLSDLAPGLNEIIPFGMSIFGTINRWIVRPLFNVLQSFIGVMGITIIILTLIVKMLLYPLTYKMLHSQAKMAALKPEISELKKKHKDDMQTQQMETMKLYREFGVSPFGGCMPMILQMPIWFALYRFFPAYIDFRGANFLWANDLSSFDAVFWLPFEIPMYGDHVSLFTLLWGVSLLGYTYYNRQMMEMAGSNPMMKYMQYVMPAMFIIFLNGYSSGLTCYLLFSNIINIGQTVITKNFIFDEEKIKAQLNRNKEKPKKKGGFQARLQKAMEEQQKLAEKKKGKK